MKLTESEKPHLKVLSIHKPIYDYFIKSGEIVNLHPHIKNEIVDAYKVEHPHYHYNTNCGVCVAEMLTLVYKWYESTH